MLVPGQGKWLVGHWSNRKSNWNLVVDLSLSSDGQFDSVENVLSMSKPIPTVYMTGKWWRDGNCLRLRARRRAYIGGLQRPSAFTQLTEKIDISYELPLNLAEGQSYIPAALRERQRGD